MQDQLWPLIIPVPFEVEVHTVPHFKAQVNGKTECLGIEYAEAFL